MLKLSIIVAVAVVSLAVAAAEPPRFRQTRRFGSLRVRNQRKFARQEAAATDAPPYPAAGVTPEIPFNLPNEPDQTYGPPEPTPDQTYGPPVPAVDQTYGPPEPTPDQTYGPPGDESAVTEPETTYGPPEEEKPTIEATAPDAAAPADAELVALNIIQPRLNFGRSRSRSAPLLVRTAQPRSRSFEIIRSEPILVYTLN